MGLGFDRPWRAKSWDRFAIPRPWSRARGVIGPEVYIEPNLDRPDLERRRQGVERLLNQLTAEAEAWAVSGQRREEQVAIGRRARILGPLGQWHEVGGTRSLPMPAVQKENTAKRKAG
jgi:hypothetical protein